MRYSKIITTLRNPVALTGVGVLALTRGIVWLLSSGSEGSSGIVPDLPMWAIVAIGAAWLFAACFWLLSLVVRRFFVMAASVMGAMYATWIMVHAVDLAVDPDLDSALSMVTYAVMIPIVITLAAVELAPPLQEVD